jgi:hypothetical protein
MEDQTVKPTGHGEMQGLVESGFLKRVEADADHLVGLMRAEQQRGRVRPWSLAELETATREGRKRLPHHRIVAALIYAIDHRAVRVAGERLDNTVFSPPTGGLPPSGATS